MGQPKRWPSFFYKLYDVETNVQIQRINGIEVALDRIKDGFDVYVDGKKVGDVKRVERVGQAMWQADGSKRYRTIMNQAIEELLVREGLIDGLGW